MNDLARRWAPFRSEISALTAEFVARGRAILGPQVEGFEQDFSSYCGVKYCTGVANGTDALEIALRAVGVGRGSRVATVANAGGYSTVAILAIGAAPVYVEIDASTLNVSPGALERILATERIDAVVATHLYGRMADVEEIDRLCRRAGVPWIEDCAQAHGARRAGRRAGAWGTAAAFSFYPTKNLGALGDGGAVTTERPEVATAARELRQYGWVSRYEVARAGGRNSRLDELQAAFLRLFLPRLDAANERRRALAARYRAELAAAELVLPPPAGEESVCHLFVVQSSRRDRLRDELRARGVDADVHYPRPDFRQPATGTAVALATTEAACASVLSLPLFPELSEAEFATAARVIRETAGG